MSHVPFYLFAALTAGCALGVVLSRNAVHAAINLLVCLLGTAGLLVLLEAYLLAALLVLVYAGAVVTLFVFIVMLIGMHGDQARPVGRGALVSAVSGLLLLGAVIVATAARGPVSAAAALPPGGSPGSSLKLYAQQLFTSYLLPVQIVAFLLLAAMIGVIVISRRQPDGAAPENKEAGGSA